VLAACSNSASKCMNRVGFFIDVRTLEDYARAQEPPNRVDEVTCWKQPSSISD
jgi:hypothetical protein